VYAFIILVDYFIEDKKHEILTTWIQLHVFEILAQILIFIFLVVGIEPRFLGKCYTTELHSQQNLFIFYVLVVLEFALRVSWLLGRHSTTRATPSALFCVGLFLRNSQLINMFFKSLKYLATYLYLKKSLQKNLLKCPIQKSTATSVSFVLKALQQKTMQT
jgi:hypothetical protein